MFKIPEGFKMQVRLEKDDWADIHVISILPGPFRYTLDDTEDPMDSSALLLKRSQPRLKIEDLTHEATALIVYAHAGADELCIYTDSLGDSSERFRLARIPGAPLRVSTVG